MLIILPIAIGILAASEQVNVNDYLLGDYLFLGELSLDGRAIYAQSITLFLREIILSAWAFLNKFITISMTQFSFKLLILSI